MYTNAQVIDVLRSIDARLARLESRPVTSTPTGAPVTPAAASPLVIPERDAKVERLALLCVGHGQPGASKACAREFGSAENLAKHNAWAHKA